jgi:hypothetical protein
MGTFSHLSTCVCTQSPKYLEMAQRHISLSLTKANVKLNAPKKLSNFVKGKAPMVQDSESYILYPANYPEHKIGKFMLGNLTLFLIMHLGIRMRLLALGIPRSC